MMRKRPRLDGLLPPTGRTADPSAVQVVRLAAPPRAAVPAALQDRLPPGLREAHADPLTALVLLHGRLAEADPAAAVRRWLGPEVDPLLVDGCAATAPAQCRRVWQLAGLPRPGESAPVLPVLVEAPALLVVEMTERLEQQSRRRWPGALLAVLCCANVYDGAELGRLRRHPRVKVCYLAEQDPAQHYDRIARGLGIDAAAAARLRDGALAAAGGSVPALRAALAFSGRGPGASAGAAGRGDHTVDRLAASAGHALGYHAGPGPEPQYVHAVAPVCCQTVHQLSAVCDGLAALDLVDRSIRDAALEHLVSGATGRQRDTPPPVARRRELDRAFYASLKAGQRVRQGPARWESPETRARGALGRPLGHGGLRGAAPVAAAVCLAAVGFATEPAAQLAVPSWPSVAAAAPDVVAMLDRARGGPCAFDGTAWALAWTQLAAVTPALTSVQLRAALETARAVGAALLATPPRLFAPAAAVEAAAATLLTDYRVVAYKVE